MVQLLRVAIICIPPPSPVNLFPWTPTVLLLFPSSIPPEKFSHAKLLGESIVLPTSAKVLLFARVIVTLLHTTGFPAPFSCKLA